MNGRRFAVYVGLFVVLAVAGVALTYWGLGVCAPPPLPGDELWTARRQLGEALALVLRIGTSDCFTGDAGGQLALAVGPRSIGVLLVLLAVIVLWESAGRHARRAWFRANGGHVVLAGTADDLEAIAHSRARFAGTFFIAPDDAGARDIARRRPFAEIVPLDVRNLSAQLARLGAPRASLLAAATPNDLSNVAIAEAGLASHGTGELLVRLEQYFVRNLSSHRLRLRATEQGRALAVVSLGQLQARRAAAAAMSGRYTIEGHPRIHIGLCGSGPALQEASYSVAGQGFGLETEPPRLTILRTGAADFTAAALRRLADAAIAEISVAEVLTTSDGLDRAIGDSIEQGPPLVSIHCVGTTPGEAEALALRWEEVLGGLRQPIPPIIVYGSVDRPLGTSGMIRIATADNLAQAREAADLMDQRARAVHQHFLDAQRRARGDAFGSAPAEVDWAHLPDSFQDDNRNVADQMDYKLARIFTLSAPGGDTARLDAAEIETLAGVAHARWWAAKALTGWHYGRPRDDRLMRHPDMIPYASLDEPGKQKDRDEVASLPDMAALNGEALKREHRVGVPRPLEDDAYAALRANLAGLPKDQVPVAVLPLDDTAMLPLAERLLSDGARIEIMLDRWTDALRQDPAATSRLAEVTRRAWRIHAVPDGNARDLLADRVAACVDQSGGIDALA